LRLVVLALIELSVATPPAGSAPVEDIARAIEPAAVSSREELWSGGPSLWMLLQSADQLIEAVRIQLHVVVEQEHELRTRRLQAGVQRCGDAAVHRMHDQINFGPLLGQPLGGPVRGGVIHDHHTEVTERLRCKRGQSGGEKITAVVGGYGDRDQRFGHRQVPTPITRSSSSSPTWRERCTILRLRRTAGRPRNASRQTRRKTDRRPV